MDSMMADTTNSPWGAALGAGLPGRGAAATAAASANSRFSHFADLPTYVVLPADAAAGHDRAAYLHAVQLALDGMGLVRWVQPHQAQAGQPRQGHCIQILVPDHVCRQAEH